MTSLEILEQEATLLSKWSTFLARVLIKLFKGTRTSVDCLPKSRWHMMNTCKNWLSKKVSRISISNRIKKFRFRINLIL